MLINFVNEHFRCIGNRVIACGSHIIGEDEEKNHGWVRCAMMQSESMETCYDLFNLDHSEMDDCISGDLGYELMVDICDKSQDIVTANNGTDKVPDIVLEGVWSERYNAECQISVPTCIENRLDEINVEQAEKEDEQSSWRKKEMMRSLKARIENFKI